MHTQVHRHRRTCAHTRTHMGHRCTQTHMYAQAQVCTHRCRYTQRYMHTQTQVLMRRHTCTHTVMGGDLWTPVGRGDMGG